MFDSQFESSPHWSIRTWLRYLQRGRGPMKRFQYCLDPYLADTFLYLRAIQGHSGLNQIDPALQDNALLPSDFAEYIYHVGSSHDKRSIIPSGLIPGGKDVKRGRQTVFFTAVNPMFAQRQRIYHSAHNAAKRGKEKRKKSILDRFQTLSDLQRVTARDWMGRSLLHTVTTSRMKIIHTCTP